MPPEACCVLLFRAKISGTTQAGFMGMVVRPPGLEPGTCGLRDQRNLSETSAWTASARGFKAACLLGMSVSAWWCAFCATRCATDFLPALNNHRCLLSGSLPSHCCPFVALDSQLSTRLDCHDRQSSVSIGPVTPRSARWLLRLCILRI